jgi:riboflavin kinase
MAAPPLQTAAKLASQVERPAAVVQTTSFRQSRPEIVGPEAPESPYPIHLSGPVQRGFGRGGKDLGCPTGNYWMYLSFIFSQSLIANLPDESIEPISSVCKPGVYYGYAQVVCVTSDCGLSEDDTKVYPMAMSLGWNPFYKNERLTAVCAHVLSQLRFSNGPAGNPYYARFRG